MSSYDQLMEADEYFDSLYGTEHEEIYEDDFHYYDPDEPFELPDMESLLNRELPNGRTLREEMELEMKKAIAAILPEYNQIVNVARSSEGNFHHIDISEQNNNTGDPEANERRHTRWSSRKVDLGKIFVITNFVLEIPSIVFDQLSSMHKPQYALLSMLLSFAAILMCIVELVYKILKDRVAWQWRSTLPWLYYPSQTQKPFGNFKDTVGLVCAVCQCIFTTITFVFVNQHADNPIKVSVWPIVFAFGLLCSKFLEKPERRNV